MAWLILATPYSVSRLPSPKCISPVDPFDAVGSFVASILRTAKCLFEWGREGGRKGEGHLRIIEIGKSSLRCDKVAEKSESLIYEHTQSSLAFLSLLMVLNGL